MKSFSKYRMEEKIINEGMLQQASLGALAGIAAAHGAKADTFNLSADADRFTPAFNTHIPANATALQSFAQHAEWEKAIKSNPAIKDITIDIMRTTQRIGSEFSVSVSATIQAPDRATAKKILVSQMMKVAAQRGVQKDMIKLLGTLKDKMDESQMPTFEIEMEITKDGAHWI